MGSTRYRFATWVLDSESPGIITMGRGPALASSGGMIP